MINDGETAVSFDQKVNPAWDDLSLIIFVADGVFAANGLDGVTLYQKGF